MANKKFKTFTNFPSLLDGLSQTQSGPNAELRSLRPSLSRHLYESDSNLIEYLHLFRATERPSKLRHCSKAVTANFIGVFVVRSINCASLSRMIRPSQLNKSVYPAYNLRIDWRPSSEGFPCSKVPLTSKVLKPSVGTVLKLSKSNYRDW